MTVQSQLARLVPKPAISDQALLAMAARAWHDFGIALFRPEDLPDDLNRQAVKNAADWLYGKRSAQYQQASGQRADG